jgi:hypothetical protein
MLISTSSLSGLSDAWRKAARPLTLYATPEWLVCNEPGTDASVLRYVLDGDRPGSMVVRKVAGGGFLGGDPLWCLFHPGGTEGSTGGSVARVGVAEERSADTPALAGPDLSGLQDKVASATRHFFPLAAASLPGSYLPGLLGGAAVSDWEPFLAVLDETARDWSCPSTGVLNVPDEHPAQSLLVKNGYIAVPGFAHAVLTVRDASLDDYVARFRNHGRVRKARVLRELRSFKESGLTVRETTLDAFDASHAALHLRQLRRYGHDVSADWLVDLMRRSAHHLGPWARMVVAERDGVPEAFTVCYSFEGEIHLKMSGFSEYAERHAGYFAMVFYELVAYAQRSGTRRIQYGPLTYEAKVGRGCTLEPRTNYLRVPEEWRENLVTLAAVAERKGRARLATLEKSWNSMD